MDLILKERAKRRHHGNSHIKLNKNLAEQERQAEADVQGAVGVISNVEQRNKLLQQVLDNKDVSNIAAFNSIAAYPRFYCGK